MQLAGFSAVGLCLFAGLNAGDYGRVELFQFLGGSAIFYLGTFVRKKK